MIKTFVASLHNRLNNSPLTFAKAKALVWDTMDEKKNLCVGISGPYVQKEMLSRAQIIVIATKEQQLVGFMLIVAEEHHARLKDYEFTRTVNPNDSLYMDLICSKGAFTTLLFSMIKIAAVLRRPFLRLSALPAVVGLYRKFGFRNAEHGCRDELPPTKLNALLTRYASTTFFFNKDHEDVVQNRYMHAFFNQLVKNHLQHDKDCDGTDRKSVV